MPTLINPNSTQTPTSEAQPNDATAAQPNDPATAQPVANPNDATADLYDRINEPLKGHGFTAPEIELITSLCTAPGPILDIGGGTGRHAIPLAERGYQITVVDSSTGMLDNLAHKLTNSEAADLISIDAADIFTWQTTQRFPLIILMWNSFNEIATTDTQAQALMHKLRGLLSEGGRVLINSDDPTSFDPAALSFTTDYPLADGTSIHQDWQVVSFDKATNTTTSLEHIQMTDINGQLLRWHDSHIVQRWWSLPEYASLAKANQLQITPHSLPVNQELYLEISTL